MQPPEQNRDLTLAPDTYLYLQNVGKGGIITVYRGPCVVSQTGQDAPILYNSDHRFEPAGRLEQAVQQAPRANEGDYVVLECPAEDNGFPTEVSQPSRTLRKGCKIVIPGPWSEALWPGQSATVIEGHRLRSNQYLIAIIYNAEEAEKNWSQTVVKPAEETETTVSKGLPQPESFAVGTRIVVKGTDVSFYIPCTGVEVVKDQRTNQYVREAVTLEQLEYCCLIGEDGKKKYPRGPKVVFPAPDQVFDEDNQSRRKFRPIELNAISGIHLKVTADFEDEDMEKTGADGNRPKRNYKEGEELFVTGKTLAIYYPREELAIIEYGEGNKRHFSTAIPRGEGRYVIDRESGKIDLVRGPKMLLVDPRHQILVRRVLSEHECSLWYPGNSEALAHNRNLAQLVTVSPSGRSGLVSEGDYRKSQGYESADMVSALMEDEYRPEAVGDQGSSGSSITRSTRYTQPRELRLNTKYDGAPRIEVWPGYAVLVVGAEGSRRVVKGPEVILPQYDEKLGFMELSTGKPKNTDHLLQTAYLCIHNNQVGDIVAFESSDHVKGKVKISLRVNFVGEDEDEMLRWFSVSNYVKYLCDHVRSLIAGMGKRNSIADIKANYVDLVRAAILGDKQADEAGESKRPGLSFEDNGMRVVEVEVLDLTLDDRDIAGLLDRAQYESVEQLIQLDRARADLETTKTQERIAQEKMVAKQQTNQKRLELEQQLFGDQLALEMVKIEAELAKLTSQTENVKAKETLTDIETQAELRRQKELAEQNHHFATERLELDLKRMDQETGAAVARFNAAKDGLQECLVALHRDDLAAKLAEACTVERWLSGDNMASSISNLLSMFPSMQQFVERGAAFHGNGDRLETSRS